jgi:O-Antigen ligase
VGDPDINLRRAAWLGAGLVGAAVFVIALNGGSYSVVARGEAFVALWWTLTLGVVVGVFPRARGGTELRLLMALFLTLIGWTAAGLLWTGSMEQTVIELTRVVGLAGVVAVVGWSLAGSDWRAAAVATTAAAAAVCALALGSRLFPSLLHSPLSGTEFRQRLAWPLNYWNALGAWGAMSLGLGLAWSAHATRWYWRGAALGAACLAGTVVYLTYSRDAVACVAVAVLTVWALGRHRWLVTVHAAVLAGAVGGTVVVIRAEPAINRGTGAAGAEWVVLALAGAAAVSLLAARLTWTSRLERHRTSRRRARVAGIAIAALALVAAAVAGPAVARRAWRSFERPAPVAAADPAQRLGTLGGDRRYLWNAALDTFERQPLHGTGAGTFEFDWLRYPQRAAFVRDAHSLYLQSLAELGLPGGLVVVAAMLVLLVGAVRRTLRQVDPVGAGAGAGCTAVVAVFCLSAGVDWMWESTAVAVLALIAGTLTLTGGAARREPLRVMPRLLTAAVPLCLVLIELSVLASAAATASSRNAARGGDLARALSAANSAIGAAPWAASGYRQRALVLEVMGSEGAAAADARRAIRREGVNWVNWLVLARIQAERGLIGPALAAARRAAALNPHAPLFAGPPRR